MTVCRFVERYQRLAAALAAKRDGVGADHTFSLAARLQPTSQSRNLNDVADSQAKPTERSGPRVAALRAREDFPLLRVEL